MLAGVAAAAAGLVIATTAKMAVPLFKETPGSSSPWSLATFVAIGVLRWPL